MANLVKPGAVVLLSAGLDSSYNLWRSLERFRVVLTLTFDYGQKAARRELERARALAKRSAVPHRAVDLTWFSEFTKTALLSEAPVPRGAEVAINDLERSKGTAKSVWVPNRNGIFLNIAAGFAEGLGAEHVIPGFNVEEAATFPDNSAAFLAALDASWKFSTEGRVRTFCFSTAMNKSEIVADGVKRELPFADLWPCYLASEKWCGECESCLRFQRALAANQLSFEELRG